MTCVWGISDNGTEPYDQLQSTLGRNFAGLRKNASMQYPIPANELKDANAHGWWLVYRNCNANTGSQPKVPVPFKDITAGKYDSYFLAGANAAKQDFTRSRPYFFSLHHEQDVDTPTQPEQGTPAEWKAAFQHVRSIFSSVSALWPQGGPVRMVFCPLYLQFMANAGEWAVSAIDPGGYELLGADVYNRVVNGKLKWGTDASKLLDPIIKYANGKGKPLIFPEVGVGTVTGKAAYIDSFCKRLTTENVVGLCWTHEPDNGWSLLTDTQAIAKLHYWGQQPFYQGGV